MELATRRGGAARSARRVPDHAAGDGAGLRPGRRTGSGGGDLAAFPAEGARETVVRCSRVHSVDAACGAVAVRLLPAPAVLGVADRHRGARYPLLDLHGRGVSGRDRSGPGGAVGSGACVVSAARAHLACGDPAAGRPAGRSRTRQLCGVDVQGHAVPVHHFGRRNGHCCSAIRCTELSVPRASDDGGVDLPHRELPHVSTHPQIGASTCLLPPPSTRAPPPREANPVCR